MSFVAEYLRAVAGLGLILGAWLLVQSVWRRAFPGTPADEDVLAGRLGCHGCTCSEHCENRRGGGATLSDGPDPRSER